MDHLGKFRIIGYQRIGAKRRSQGKYTGTRECLDWYAKKFQLLMIGNGKPLNKENFMVRFIFWKNYASASSVHSVVSNSLRPHGLQPTRLLCPRNSPGKNTGVDSHSLLQRILLTQDQTWVSCTGGKFFTDWATREAHPSGIMFFVCLCVLILKMKLDLYFQHFSKYWYSRHVQGYGTNPFDRFFFV